MSHNELFNLIYLSQIVLISFIMPFWVIKRFKQMTIKYPPAEYPKLYPVSVSKLNFSLMKFKFMNIVAAALGFVFIAITVIIGAEELLNWDSQSMITITFFIQVVPFIYLSLSGIKYQQVMRQVNTSHVRKAHLAPRNIWLFIPTHMLVSVVLSLLGYIAMVVFVQQNPFPGFVGYWNILFVFTLNGFYFYMIHKTIVSRQHDPHQSHEDRMIHISLVTKILALGAIFANLFLATNLLLSVLELRHVGDIIQSLYFQLVALMMSQTTTYEPEDYSVYQNDSVSPQSKLL